MLPEYIGKKAFFGGTPPLPESAGYAIVLGFGAFFSVFTTALVYADKYVNGTEHTSEYFNTAGRSVKTGLTASVIVSQWTWAATLLQSSNVAWNYGVSGPFWYASGATIQVLLFGILAIEVKRRAPTAHTVCEMVLAR
jgi:Na+/proline symporter